MPVTRDTLAEEVVEHLNLTVADFVRMCDMYPSPQGVSQKVKDVIAQTIESLTPLKLLALISQHHSRDILTNVPDEFNDENGCDGMSALRALGISSLTRAVFNVVLADDATFDPAEIFVMDELLLRPAAESTHAD